MLRFVALGDTGKANEGQYAVGRALAVACEQRGGCAFGMLLGDNFYPTGVDSVDDAQWEDKFEKPYEPVPFPFWVVLGNHDYGGDGAGWEYWRTDHQVSYTARSAKWKMPSKHYTFSDGPIDFFALDTNAIFWDQGGEQERLMPQRYANAVRPWRIAFGHHPYISNGPHGNAGKYDDIPSFLNLFADGRHVKKFMENHICSKVDLYLCGHDHNLQDLKPKCGTEFIVSGAGASTTKLERDNPVYFESDRIGFVMIEATSEKLDVRFYVREGNGDFFVRHTRTIAAQP